MDWSAQSLSLPPEVRLLRPVLADDSGRPGPRGRGRLRGLDPAAPAASGSSRIWVGRVVAVFFFFGGGTGRRKVVFVFGPPLQPQGRFVFVCSWFAFTTTKKGYFERQAGTPAKHVRTSFRNTKVTPLMECPLFRDTTMLSSLVRSLGSGFVGASPACFGLLI